MNFDPSDEQRMLKESLGRFVEERYTFGHRHAYTNAPEGWSREAWKAYADLGLLAIPFAEEHGGLGGGAVETMIVMEAFGSALALEPYLSTVVLCGGLLRLAASPDIQGRLIPRIASGDLVLSLAHGERQARYDLADVRTTARREGNQWVLDGSKFQILQGDSADQFIVSARVSGESRDPSGIALFLVDATADGVDRQGYPTQDGSRACDLVLRGVRVGDADVVGRPGDAIAVLRQVIDSAIAALCAEAVGVMDRMLGLTVEYLKTRQQFGRAIGTFQALQHQAADMFVGLEQARSMALFATLMTGEPDALERSKAIAAAKVQIGRSARIVGPKAIQLHGGIGMTDEMMVAHCFKRSTMIDYLFGDVDHHGAALAAMGGLYAAPRDAEMLA